MTIVHSKLAQHAGRLAEAGDLMKRSHASAEGSRLGALIDEIYLALGVSGRATAACDSIRAFVRIQGEEFRGSLPMLLMHWAVSLGDIDLGYEIGNSALDSFEQQRAVPVEGFVPQLWVAEMKPFRRDPRFHQFAGERLRLLEWWKAKGPPDGCELRKGRLQVLQ